MADKTTNNAENEAIENQADDAAGETAAQEAPEIDSKYRMILLAAQRSKQLQHGANPRVGADPKKTKPTRIALEEIKNKKVNYRILEED